MNADIFRRRQNAFILWRVQNTSVPPAIIIGQLKEGAPIHFINDKKLSLSQDVEHPDLWILPAADCNLIDNEVYHYWFEVTDALPSRSQSRISITDPFAYTVDWRLVAPKPVGTGYSDDDGYPAAIIKFSNGQLIPCDAGGEEGNLENDIFLDNLPQNNQSVIYELPTAWTHTGTAGERQIGVGSFCDVNALIERRSEGNNFTELSVTQMGRAYLLEMGFNALEILPPADSFYKREWGYGTTNFFAPDFDLGFAQDYTWAVPNRDLRALIASCHKNGIRFFQDVVMAFTRTNAYLAAAPDEFFILDPRANKSDPDAHNSRANNDDNLRNGFGSTLFRYAFFTESYDPVSGNRLQLSPARQLMKASLIRWMQDFHVDGIRMDSVENVANWDFIQEYRQLGWELWQDRFGNDKRFIVVGEELTEPLALLTQGRLDGLWHERFKKYIRRALIGKNAEDEPSFEWTVRKAIDCRVQNFGDGAQCIIYLTSHDVEGPGNERLFNFLQNNGIFDTEKRIKLGFACLLTAVGIPMVLAGEEFADQHDLFNNDGNVDQAGGKQVDPVNFSRIEDDWRKRIKEFVSVLVKFRSTNKALSVNDTSFIHTDFAEGKRVIVWRRGITDSGEVVVVVANFSDYGTPDPGNANAEYVVNNWPATSPGKSWIEITQGRRVSEQWVGREPIFPWEAKIYALSGE
ncbi:MAG: hypothetical protein JWP81_1250 [Ferruginibacter sp.]|nr:hypothetical protein [Ferruginibacter sp.]